MLITQLLPFMYELSRNKPLFTRLGFSFNRIEDCFFLNYSSALLTLARISFPKQSLMRFVDIFFVYFTRFNDT
jgi:hypothetical protein